MSGYGDTRLPANFWKDVHPEPNTGCWLWGLSLTAEGYGRYRVRGDTYAHRLAWTALRGPIPDGLYIDHLCRNRACCNPEHLEPVTARENVLRSPHHRWKTHCLRGHAFMEENTLWRFDKRSGQMQRKCRECDRMRKRVSWRGAAA